MNSLKFVVQNRMEEKRFLISHHNAYEILSGADYDDNTMRVCKVPNLFDEDVISQPTSALARSGKLPCHLPREIKDKIVSFLVASCIHTREYHLAALALGISHTVLQSWWRWYANRKSGLYTTVEDWIRQLSRTLCLLQSIYDEAYTGEIWHQQSCNFPSLGIVHPFGFSVDRKVKPHHLVKRDMAGQMSTSLELREDPGRVMEGMGKPVVMYTGPRLCDVMVANTTGIDDGVYYCNKIVFPILMLRIQGVTVARAEEWQNARHEWKRFADLVRWSMDGCELYMEVTYVQYSETEMMGSPYSVHTAQKVFVKP